MARRKKNILEELEALEEKKPVCEEDDTDFSDLEIDEAKEKDADVADDVDVEDEASAEGEADAEGVDDLVDDLDSEVEELEDIDVEKDDMSEFKDKLNQILDSLSDLKSAINGDELAEEDEPEMTDTEMTDTSDDEAEINSDEDSIVDTSEGEEEDFYKKEDFSPLFANQGSLTEEFKSKANTVFNAVLQEKVLVVAEKVAQKANKIVNKKVKRLIGTIAEDVNDYFDYIVEEWMAENELAIEQGIRNNLVENVLFKFKKALAESYIELPEEDLVVMEELEKKTSDLQTRLDGVMSENIKLRKHLVESKKSEILHSLTEGLTVAEVDRFKKLSKTVDFESIEQYRSSLKTLKESVVKPSLSTTETKETKQALKEQVEEVKTEKNDGYIDISAIDPTRMFTDVQIVRSPKIDDYATHLSRSIKA